MKFDLVPVKKWFGFTRRERRSSFILILIIIVVYTMRFLVPQSDMEVKDVTANFIAEYQIPEETQVSTAEKKLFVFDPNNTSYETLIELGFNSRSAHTLLNYRAKGGKFNKPDDIKKVYGIDDSQAMQLIPYISINKETIRYDQDSSFLKKRKKVELNSCDSVSLVALPGIGPVLSGRIIKYRRLLGSYSNIEQISEVYGISPETFDLIKNRLIVDTLLIKKININNAEFKDLSRFPYLENYEVAAILKFRELQDSIVSIDDLIKNKVLSKEKAQKLSPYLVY